jgi:Domain of unknown function DUF11
MPGMGLRTRRLLLPALAAALLILALDGAGASAEELPVADLALLSMTADLGHAKLGDRVTFTIVATNNGPDPVDLNVVEDPWQLYGDIYPRADFTLVAETCSGGVSADTPACEWGVAQPGQTFTVRAVMKVNESAPRMASNTACVFSWAGPINDPNPANDCVTTTLRILASRDHG